MVVLYNEHEQNNICLGKQFRDCQMLELRRDAELVLG